MSGVILPLVLRLLAGAGLLVAAYALWRVLRRISDATPEHVSQVAVSRLAHAVLVLALVAPCLAFVSPRPSPLKGADAVGSTAADYAAPITGDAGGGSGYTLLGDWAALPVWDLELATASVGLLLFTAAVVGLSLLALRMLALVKLIRRAELVRRIGRVDVRVSDDIRVPFSTVVRGRADVVVPFSLLDRGRDLEMAVRHELHHHRRRDTSWAIALAILRAVFPWNPAARAWERELSLCQELACDEQLLARGLPLAPYAECLYRVAREAAQTPDLVASTAMARPSHGSAVLKRRIEMMTEKERREGGLTGRSRLAAGVGIALLLGAAWGVEAALPDAQVDGAYGVAVTEVAAKEDSYFPAPADHSFGPGERLAAPDIDFMDPDGRSSRLSDLEGKVVLVLFWADWCKPCIKDMPEVKALAARFADEDFEVVGVSLSESRSAFEAFVSTHELPWPQYFSGDKWGSTPMKDYGVRAIPTHFLLDQEGRIVSKSVSLQGVDEEIRTLLAQPSATY